MVSTEPLTRLVAFVGVFAVGAIGEAAAPRRSRLHSRLPRWPSNLAIAALNNGFLRVVFPATAVSLALIGEDNIGACSITRPFRGGLQ